MVPGLWLEPEVVGVRSPVGDQLPEEAFFQRGGVRVTEHGRHQLDLRHPAAAGAPGRGRGPAGRASSGVGYFKLDYNINPGSGTDAGGVSPGVGLLGHNRAYLDWLDGGAGPPSRAGRWRTAPPAACAPTTRNCPGPRCTPPATSRTTGSTRRSRPPRPVAVAPEQAAVWAYPQPEFTDDEIAFTLCSALLGRIHLSGFLDRMSRAAARAGARGGAVYRSIRAELADAVPVLAARPARLDRSGAGARPAHVLRATRCWRSGGARRTPRWPDRRTADQLPLTGFPPGAQLQVSVLYPAASDVSAHWDAGARTLAVTLPRAPQACVLRLSPAA